MRTIQIGDDRYSVPSTWNEMTDEQLKNIAWLSLQPEMPLQYMKVRILLNWLGGYVSSRYDLRKYIMGGKDYDTVQTFMCIRRKRYPVNGELLAALCEVCDFLFIPEDATSEAETSISVSNVVRKSYRLAPALTRNPYPEFWLRGHIYHGPKDGLFDISFEQYIYLCTYLDNLRHGGQLPNVLATLWHNSPRFEVLLIEDDARALARLDKERQLVMYWFVSSCLEQYRTMFPRVFSGNGGGKRGNTLDNQLRLLNSLADGDVTKKNAVRRGLLMDAFYSMDESVRQREELEKQTRR